MVETEFAYRALRDKALGDSIDFVVNLWSKKRNKAQE